MLGQSVALSSEGCGFDPKTTCEGKCVDHVRLHVIDGAKNASST